MTPRQLALNIVQRLHEHGHVALWAGGCVRDSLLGREPADYDVATSATPDQIVALFGKHRVLSIGAAFGVIIVLGPRGTGLQTEVATVRSDGEYVDGRRPESVLFCSAEEDARRRDFTVNGMFFDPLNEEVIDYVGGQLDLRNNLLRCIGRPADRFNEDKLRMLRAVRFAATFQFEIESETLQSVTQTAHQITQVSAERILQELRRMLAHPHRQMAFRLMQQAGLLFGILPDYEQASASGGVSMELVAEMLGHLQSQEFLPAAAILMLPFHAPEKPISRQRLGTVRQTCRNLTMSNKEVATVEWLIESLDSLRMFRQQPLHVVRPLLADPRADILLQTARAVADINPSFPSHDDPVEADEFRTAWSAKELFPPPLINGQDIQQQGIAPGPKIRTLLNAVRNAQLDQQLENRSDALKLLQQLIAADA